MEGDSEMRCANCWFANRDIRTLLLQRIKTKSSDDLNNRWLPVVIACHLDPSIPKTDSDLCSDPRRLRIILACLIAGLNIR